VTLCGSTPTLRAGSNSASRCGVLDRTRSLHRQIFLAKSAQNGHPVGSRFLMARWPIWAHQTCSSHEVCLEQRHCTNVFPHSMILDGSGWSGFKAASYSSSNSGCPARIVEMSQGHLTRARVASAETTALTVRCSVSDYGFPYVLLTRSVRRALEHESFPTPSRDLFQINPGVEVGAMPRETHPDENPSTTSFGALRLVEVRRQSTSEAWSRHDAFSSWNLTALRGE
jgi:hypothetical protein